jgi:signal transduction histidine kinase/DNA-binding response OmpR family regulator
VTWESSVHFHTLIEVLATTMAAAVGVVALMRFYSRHENTMLFVGAAFLGTALLDGYHALVTSSYFSKAFPSTLGSLIPWSWTASRIFLALFLLLSWLIWWHEKRSGSKMATSPLRIYAATAFATIVSFTFFAFVPLPQAHYPDLWFHRPQELIPAVLLLAALIGYMRKGYWRHSTFEHWLVLSLIVGFMGQAMFMSFSGQIFDPAFDAAHTLKIVSYVLVLTGLFISIFRLFKRAETFAIDLAIQAAELEDARDAALEAVETRSQFLANVSHEIRTPMNAVLGMTELALSTELTVEQREYLETARTSVEALITIVNDLLDLSKIEADKLELDSIPFGLRATVDNSVKTLSISAASKGLALDWAVSPSIPDCIVGDPGRLRQVLVNLIGNAIKFTPEGQIRVVVEPVHIGDADIELRFDVHDTGIGIPPDKLERVFEAFTQAEASTTRRFGGTGLGLTISSQLVQLMGGEIWAESTPGVGTAIHFTATLAVDTSVETVASSTPSNDLLPVVVLAETDANPDVLVEMLVQGGIHSIVVTNEAEAAATVGAEGPGPTPRVVLVANADGRFEGLQRMMESEDFDELSVIALVSVGRRGDAADFRRLGLSGYLTRPVLQTDLVDAVRAAESESLRDGTFITVHWLRERRPQLRVLLVDDSATNRHLSTRLLEIRGHSVETAEDGLRAYEAWQNGRFDVILMDVQLPGMDGLEVAAAIRRDEQDGVRTPIVALTAFASESDKRRCFDAGMDGYVSKPFRAEELYAAIENFDTPLPTSHDATSQRAGGSGPIDREAALAVTGGSVELLAEIATIFLEEYPGLMDTIEAGFASDDLGSVERASHRLKGSLGMLAARPAQEAAGILEQSARAEEAAPARDAWIVLSAEIQFLVSDLTDIASNKAIATGAASPI